MNNLEILRALNKLNLSGTVGVFPADLIPKVWTKPAAIVANTDDHTKPGTHWVAFYVGDDGKGIFFDSYGLAPTIAGHVERLRANCRYYVWNDKQLQSEMSEVCGQFCIVCLCFLRAGFDLDRFTSCFTRQYNENDGIAREFYENLMSKSKQKCNVLGIDQNVYGGGNMFTQKCCCRIKKTHI